MNTQEAQYCSIHCFPPTHTHNLQGVGVVIPTQEGLGVQ